MHKSRLGALVVDCQGGDMFEHAEFWGAALGSTPESREGQVNAQFLRLDGSPREAQVILQQVDHPSRVHFDIESDDIEAEVKRLQALGADLPEYRLLIDTVPYKYIGFACGGFLMVFGLISWVEGRPSRKAAMIAIGAVIALIIVYDVPFDSLLLPPNGSQG